MPMVSACHTIQREERRREREKEGEREEEESGLRIGV